MVDNKQKNLTVFQKLNNILTPDGVNPEIELSNKYSMGSDVLVKTTDKAEFQRKSLQAKQGKYLSSMWGKVEDNLFQQSIQYEMTRLGSYSDFENMEFYPELAATLDILMEESTTVNDKGRILNIYSDSPRIRGVLEDLFFNRLDIHTVLPMWVRNTCKYGDNFVYLNTSDKYGITGAKQMPNFEMERREGGVYDAISAKLNSVQQNTKDRSEEGKEQRVRFFWRGRDLEFESWQIAHFRLLGDDRKLPYGTSVLEKSRRIWKQLLLSEDAMLVYRVTRAPERRVYKIYVGNIDDEDVQPYVNEIANRFKRANVVDPQTGQVDLRYNQLANDQDFFIPVRDENAPNPIDTLPGACIALDTKIPLLDGRTLELREIIEEWDSGNRDLWVYSCDPETGALAPGMITWAGETRKNAEVVKITLDNGESITTTPDHKWVHRTKGFIEAKDLVVGDSLMPFYRDTKKIRSNTNRYERVWDSHKQEWVFTHRMVTDNVNGFGLIKELVHDEKYVNEAKQTRHHKDYDRFNNNPSNLVWMSGADHMKYHQSVIMDTIWSDPEENVRKITNGVNRFINSMTLEERTLRGEQSKYNSINSRDKAKETFNGNPDKANIIKQRGIAISEAKSTEEFKKQFSSIAKTNWEITGYGDKVFSKKQTLTFTDELYHMFFEMFKLCGKADLTLVELNKSEDFMGEFVNSNEGIRSSLTNLDQFTMNHLDKMLKECGFKNYRDWCKVTAKELGYKNVRAWRYFINKNNKLEVEANYNHKIISIEWLEERQDTGTITVDGDELYHNYHTFATESGVFIKNSNLDQIADIEYLQRKLFTALRVPKSFLGFDDPQGDGKNLALMDVRFARTINRIQQSLLQELNKIAIIHLVLLGFEDDLNSFTITMNNPSTQAEMLRIEHLQSKFTAIQSAVVDAGNGFGIMSMTRAKRDVLGWSDAEIKQDLLEQRMEKAAAAELANTASVIKNTGFFDKVDKLYGDIDKAREGGQSAEGGDDAGGPAGGGGGGFGGGGIGGDDIDFGDEEAGDEEVGGEDIGGGFGEDLGGEEGGAEPAAGAEEPAAGAEGGLGEMFKIGKRILAEEKLVLTDKLTKRKTRFKNIHMNRLMESLVNDGKAADDINENRVSITDKGMRINQNVDDMLKDIEDRIGGMDEIK